MPRTLHRLSPVKVKNTKDTGIYADGGGLYLQVKATETAPSIRVGCFATLLQRRTRMVGRKSARWGWGLSHTISLADAREKALKCRKLRDQGIDPIEALDGLTMPTLRSRLPAL